MKMAMKSGQIIIKEASSVQFTIIKSWGKMKWSRSDQTLSGPADHELLNRLAGMVRLPENIEAERQRMNDVVAAIDKERMKEDPVPLYKYPVKMPLFKHQTRGANMALMVFDLVKPPKEDDKGEKDSTSNRNV